MRGPSGAEKLIIAVSIDASATQQESPLIWMQGY